MVGFLILPVGLVFGAYDQAMYEFPLYQNSISGSERIHKEDSRYATVLGRLPGARIKAMMQTFLDTVGVRPDLIFYETHNIAFGTASGTNMFTKNDATVTIAPGLYETDKDGCTWIIKHEIGHIKYNDPFTMQCVPCI